MNISVLQWNIWYQEDINNIVALLKDVKPDIICLQELTIGHKIQNGKNAPKFITEELGYESFYHEIPTEDEGVKLANGIFTKFPISDTRWGWINEQKGERHYDNEHRVYIEATLDIDGRNLTVGTTHMSYTNCFEVTPRKLEETDKLVNLINRNQLGFILTGDFNAQPDSEVIERITRQLKNAGPDYSQKSWTTKPFSYDGFEANTLDWRLDYVFVTQDIEVLSAEIIKTDFSDHLPVLVKLDLSKQQAS